MGKKTYSIVMIGITEAERNVLRNIFKLSQYRTYSYNVAVQGEVMDVLMVDADDPEAMKEWRERTGKSPSSAGYNISYSQNIPTILIAKEPPQDSTLYYMRRPFVASRVINVLDHVAIKELQSDQARIIGLENQPKPNDKVIPAIVTKPPVEEQQSNILTALVVDDSGPVRKQIELELKLFGIEVETVATGEQAIECFNQNRYNLIFLDVVLPGVDGYQLCKMLKKDKAKKKTPVIMLTSKSSPFDRVKGALAGCDAYLTKPVKQETFQKVVKKYLR
jgi:twitching motility two-component system response regulator PilG